MPNVIISFDSGYIKMNGERTLYAIVRMGRKKIKFNTGVSINPDHFDREKSLVRKSHNDHSDYNLMIESTKSRINEIFVRYRLLFEELSPDLLVKEFKISSTSVDFHTFLDNAIHERSGELTDSTILQHASQANKLKKFSNSLAFAQLDADFMARYNRWLITSEKNDINTRHLSFKFLKTYINIAIRKRIITFNPLKDWMPVKHSSAERVFLTEQEVNEFIDIYRANLLPKNKHNVVRHFLFMCFTGLRISDLRAIEMDQIVNNTLVFSAQKTRSRQLKLVKIPLAPIVLDLINDEAPFRISGKVFRTFSEQHMRRTIKNLATEIGIEKDISLHTGRHTFATMFLRRSKNLAVLQKLLGHSKIEQTMVYAHVMTEDIEDEMRIAFDEF